MDRKIGRTAINPLGYTDCQRLAELFGECFITKTVKKSSGWFWTLGLVGVVLVFLMLPRPNSAPPQKFNLPQNQNFMSLQGQRIGTESFKNKVVILNFFTTWCPYCREEIQTLNQVRKLYPESEVLILGLTVDPAESIFKIKSYLQSQGIRYPVLGPDPDVFISFGFSGGGIPVTLIYNRHGKIQEHWVGYHTLDDFKKVIQASK